MRYPIIATILLILYSFFAIWVRISIFPSIDLSLSSQKLLDVSLLLIPVANTAAIAMGWFFHVLSTIKPTGSSSLNPEQLRLISRIVFWIPPCAPTLSVGWAFTL